MLVMSDAARTLMRWELNRPPEFSMKQNSGYANDTGGGDGGPVRLGRGKWEGMCGRQRGRRGNLIGD